jgi:hypothetical protein
MMRALAMIIPGQANVTCTQSKVTNPSILLELKIYDKVLSKRNRPRNYFSKKQN